MTFEEKVKVLKKLKTAGITDLKSLAALDTKAIINLANKNFNTIEGIVDLQENAKDLFSYLMDDAK